MNKFFLGGWIASIVCSAMLVDWVPRYSVVAPSILSKCYSGVSYIIRRIAEMPNLR